ncbi:XRE family transcriptional regulator [Streptococcus sp. HF-2466]|uniref:XRE family transcriptional regulator n=1 Tax=Streptococcus sp. HF-2466 TaxID=2785792 RepID=UPI00189E0352|nr:S24 family peptidase [Streptococcus sp. HF-2466]MBF7050528.1 helix-turn-helix transcriptional regulator [Streptococcus sp. HF-2466]
MTDVELAIYIGEKIKEYRKLKGLTQKELAKKIGMGDTTIANYEKGFRTPKKNTLFKLAKAFDISIDDLFPPIQTTNIVSLPLTNTAKAISDTVERLEEPRRVIVLDTAKMQLEEQKRAQNELNEERTEYHVFEKLSAGNGYDYMEDRNYDVVFYNKDIDHDFASWVYGDSMEPKFLDGSVALIKETGWDYDGAVYAVDWDGQSYIKKVYKEKDGLRLVSLNDKYADKFAPFSEEPRIIGKVVGNFMPMEN